MRYRPHIVGLSLYTKDLYLVITLNLIILHDEKCHFSVKSVVLFMKTVLFTEKRSVFHMKSVKSTAFHTKDHFQGNVTLCFVNLPDQKTVGNSLQPIGVFITGNYSSKLQLRSTIDAIGQCG